MNELLTLAAEGARIDLLGQPLLIEFNLASAAERMALLGDWSPLFRLLAGEAVLAAGTLTLCGCPASEGVQRGRIGLARLDPLLPNVWSAEHFLAASAELSGLNPRAARRAVSATFDKLGLGGLGARRLGHLQLGERRALLVAHALLTDPQVLCLEQPLLGLDTTAEELLLSIIERATQGRRLVVSLSDPSSSPGERELMRAASAVFRLEAGVVLPEPRELPRSGRVAVTICRNHEAFSAALQARKLRAHPSHEAGILNALTSAGVGPAWRYLVELDGDSTSAILDAALETEAGLVELIPS